MNENGRTPRAAAPGPVPVWLLVIAAAMLLPSAVGGKDAGLVNGEGRLRGDPKAPVTLIEYSDFTCGYCRKFFQETWPRLQARYVDTGKVRFLYRDFPRASEGAAVNAALAARCAGDQGRYWPMHDRLYGRHHEAAELQRHAAAIGLDVPAFAACVQDGKHRDGIFQDKEEGLDVGVRGTPGFVLQLTKQTGEPAILIPGAFPFDVFAEQIDRLLKLDQAR
jgi:protein-disulfide isomerase